MMERSFRGIATLLIVLVTFGCQINSPASRQAFVDDFDRVIGRTVDKDELIESYRSDYSYRHIKVKEVVSKDDGSTHIILDWGTDGCRVAEVIKGNTIIDWYYVANKEQCYMPVNWGGPW